jgi:hypothetical protein
MVITLYFYCKIVNNYLGPNPGLEPQVNPGFGFEKPAGYPGLWGPGDPGLEVLVSSLLSSRINVKRSSYTTTVEPSGTRRRGLVALAGNDLCLWFGSV